MKITLTFRDNEARIYFRLLRNRYNTKSRARDIEGKLLRCALMEIVGEQAEDELREKHPEPDVELIREKPGHYLQTLFPESTSEYVPRNFSQGE